MPKFDFSGSKLRVARQRKGWTQQQLANRIDRSQPLIVLWELGYETPPTEKLLEVADVLGVPVELLFDATDEVPA
jgi:transcriptional regulator with XRE-family HTH domain